MIRVVVGILKRDKTLLVAERPEGKPYSGYWEFPGGKVEADECSEDALKRELQEELGVTVTSAKLWFEHAHTYPDKTVQLEIWLVDKFEGEPHSKENQTLSWVTVEQIDTLKLLEGNIPIMAKIKSLIAG